MSSDPAAGQGAVILDAHTGEVEGIVVWDNMRPEVDNDIEAAILNVWGKWDDGSWQKETSEATEKVDRSC